MANFGHCVELTLGANWTARLEKPPAQSLQLDAKVIEAPDGVVLTLRVDSDVGIADGCGTDLIGDVVVRAKQRPYC